MDKAVNGMKRLSDDDLMLLIGLIHRLATDETN